MTAISSTPRAGIILVPLDGTAAAVQAISLAMRLATPGQHVNLFSISPNDAPLHHVDAEAIRTTWAARYPDTTVDADQVAGDAVEEILAASVQRDVRLIVMTTHSPATGRPAAETVGGQVALRSHVPVVLIPIKDGAPQATLHRLVVPLDGSMRAAQSLPVAALLARRLSVPVSLITVVDVHASLPPAYAYSSPTADPELQDAIAQLQAQGAATLRHAEQELHCAGVSATASLVAGPTIPCILAALRPGDMLVMATRGAAQAAFSKVGRVAANLLEEATVPVVVFQPELADAVSMCTVPDWESVVMAELAHHRAVARA